MTSFRLHGLPLLAALLCVTHAAAAAPKTMRIAVAHFKHEATTFNKARVDIADFGPTLEGARLLAHLEVGDFARAMKWDPVTLIPLRSPGPPAGGSSRGWIKRSAFEFHIERMIKDLRSNLPVDGVYLALHGAAAVEGVDRPEAEVARRFREVVGANVPIVATFDPHGNQSAEFLRWADAAFVVKYYPHYDFRLQAQRAAHVLLQMIRRDYVAASATRKVPILLPTVLMGTDRPPFSRIVQRALIWEASHPDLYVNWFFGFPWSDVKDVGMTIQVIANGDEALANRVADQMATLVWDSRAAMVEAQFPQPAAAVARATSDVAAGRGPVVLADYSDRTGDATFILAELIKQQTANVVYVALTDQALVEKLIRSDAKAGDRFDEEVGGRLATASGSPVRINGVISYAGECLNEFESPLSCIIVAFGKNNHLVISSHLLQVWIPRQLVQLPVKTSRNTIYVVKSRVHFRRAFEDTGLAASIYVVDAPQPFVGTVHLEALPYENADLKSFFPYSKQNVLVPRSDKLLQRGATHGGKMPCNAPDAQGCISDYN